MYVHAYYVLVYFCAGWFDKEIKTIEYLKSEFRGVYCWLCVFDNMCVCMLSHYIHVYDYKYLLQYLLMYV